MSVKSIKPKHVIPVLAVACVIVAILVMQVLMWSPNKEGNQGSAGLIGGSFSLTDHTGKSVTEKDFKGKYQLIYFGYTYCPEICPMSLQSVADAMELLGPVADAITPLFITVDPERDTPEQLASYVENFDHRMVGLTGTPAEISAAKKAFRVYSKKVVSEDAVDFDHSAITFLMDRDGHYLAHFAYGVSGEAMAERIRPLLKVRPEQKL
jgi:protein SCO1/2